MHIISVLVWQLCITAVLARIDYCAPSLCDQVHGAVHVACSRDKGFDPRICPPDAQQIDLGEDMRQLILDAHNKRRSQVAQGRLLDFPPAARMMKIDWDDELAYVAGFNVRKCSQHYDQCCATPNYSRPGQSVAISRSYVHTLNNDIKTIVRMIDSMWFAQFLHCPPLFVGGLGKAEYKVDDFTRMVHQNNSRIGCAVSIFKVNGAYNTLMACNYQYMSVIGEEIYEVGAPCSMCSGECSTAHPGLCL